MIRKPKRDMTRPQAPHGRPWEIRWRSLWAGRLVAEKGLTGAAAWNEAFKAMYGSTLPPGSPRAPMGGIGKMYPDGLPLLRVMALPPGGR